MIFYIIVFATGFILGIIIFAALEITALIRKNCGGLGPPRMTWEELDQYVDKEIKARELRKNNSSEGVISKTEGL